MCRGMCTWHPELVTLIQSSQLLQICTSCGSRAGYGIFVLRGWYLSIYLLIFQVTASFGNDFTGSQMLSEEVASYLFWTFCFCVLYLLHWNNHSSFTFSVPVMIFADVTSHLKHSFSSLKNLSLLAQFGLSLITHPYLFQFLNSVFKTRRIFPQ